MRQSRAPTASQLENPLPPTSSTKTGRIFGKNSLGEFFLIAFTPPPLTPSHNALAPVGGYRLETKLMSASHDLFAILWVLIYCITNTTLDILF